MRTSRRDTYEGRKSEELMQTIQAKVLGMETQKAVLEGLDEVPVVKLDAEGMGLVAIPLSEWPGGEVTAKKWEGMTVTIITDPTKGTIRVKPLRKL